MTEIERKNTLPNGILRIKSYLTSLKPAERKVADFILGNVNEVIHLSITKMAENVGVSEATVVKFCQHIGYSGYQELKIILAQAGEKEHGEHIYGEIEANDNLDIIIEKIFQIYNQSLNNTKELLKNANVKTSVEMILKARRLYFFGFGASGIVA